MLSPGLDRIPLSPSVEGLLLHLSSLGLTSPMPTESIWLSVWQPLPMFFSFLTASAGCEKQQLKECEPSLNLSSVYLQDWRRLSVPPGCWRCHLIDLTYRPAVCEFTAWWPNNLNRSARAGTRVSTQTFHSHLLVLHWRSRHWPSTLLSPC